MSSLLIDDNDELWNLFDEFDINEKNKESTNNTCKCNNVKLQDNVYICEDCNTIRGKFIDQQSEWRYYGSEDSRKSDPTRCGMPTNELLPELSLGSVISNEYNTSYSMYKIRKYQKWNSTSYKERSMYEIIDNISLNATNSGISQTIIDEAKLLYKEISDKKISRGSNRTGLIASSIYMSCKKHNVPRSAREIAKVFNIDITTMTKGCKKFHDITKKNVICSTPDDFIIRFCCKLNVSNDYLEFCKSIIDKADHYSVVSENAPPSIAAGVIFLVSNLCNLKIQKKDISSNCDISEVTINKCHKKLNKYKKLLIEQKYIDKYNIKL